MTQKKKSDITPDSKAAAAKKVRKPVLAVVSKTDKTIDDAPPTPKTPAKEATPEQYAKAKEIILASSFYTKLDDWYKKGILAFLDRKDHFSFLIASHFELAETQAEVDELIHHLIRPANSFLHSQSPCPDAFMQNGFMYVDKINCDLEALKKNPDFWWQPIRNIAATELAHSLARFKHNAQTGHAINFCHIINATPDNGVKTLTQIMKERTDVNQ